jgi:hypothetical protein
MFLKGDGDLVMPQNGCVVRIVRTCMPGGVEAGG